MTAPTLDRPDADQRRRLQPSREQLRVAAAIFSAATEDVTSVVVPIALPEGADAANGERAPEPRPEHPGGYWLADRGRPGGLHGFEAARDAASAAAEAYLRMLGADGLPGWVCIRPDGTWVALDG